MSTLKNYFKLTSNFNLIIIAIYCCRFESGAGRDLV